MSLIDHVVGLVEYAGGGVAASVTTFYVGLAIARRDPDAARRLLEQMEREMGQAHGMTPEQVEVQMRAASRSIADYLAHTTNRGGGG